MNIYTLAYRLGLTPWEHTRAGFRSELGTLLDHVRFEPGYIALASFLFSGVVVVDSIDDAIGLFGEHSPRFAASLIGGDEALQDHFYDAVDAPFVGNGFTRWVDGQFALGRPELGLSNWQHGRLFARSGVLSGDSVYTLRVRAVQHDADIHR